MKTIQDQYLELMREIEKLPDSKQVQKVSLMFEYFHKAGSSLLVDAVMSFDKHCDELQSTITAQEDEINELKKELEILKRPVSKKANRLHSPETMLVDGVDD